jgi:uncharacterized membrane protein YfcA
MGLELIQLCVFALAVLIAGISKSGFAGGLGVLTVPILSFFMSPMLAVSLLLPALLLLDAMSLCAWWGKQDNNMLVLLIPAGIVGVVIGYLTVSLINENQVRLLLGIVTLIFGLHGFIRFGANKPVAKVYGCLFGMLGGFTSFVSHAGGPPLNFYWLCSCKLLLYCIHEQLNRICS